MYITNGRAEVVSYDDLIKNGGMTACKEKGLVRSEGKAVRVIDKRKLFG